MSKKAEKKAKDKDEIKKASLDDNKVDDVNSEQSSNKKDDIENANDLQDDKLKININLSKENISDSNDEVKNSSLDETKDIKEEQIVEEKKVETKKTDEELTEKEKQEIDELKAKLKEIDLSTLEKQEDKQETSKSSVETKENTAVEDGEITLQAISSTDVELKRKIAQIKSELKSDLSYRERFKNLFKSKKQKQLEKELIEKKAIKLSKSKKEVKYVLTSFKSTIGLFSIFYSRNDMPWRIGIACIVGLIMSLVSVIFVQNTGVVITGMSGIFQGIARISRVLLIKNGIGDSINDPTINMIYNLMFYGMYLLVNIPLIIFSYKKIGKNFTIISTIPVVISNVIPLLINLIPNVNELFIFGDTRPTELSIVQQIQNGVPVLVEEHTELYNNGVSILTFIFKETNSTLVTDAPKFIPMVLYTLGAGLINGFAFSMIIAVGGSTGGLDFISFYFAYKKNKSLGPVLLAFNVASVFITTMLGSYISAVVVNPQAYSGYEYFFSQNLFTGIIYAITLSTMIGNLFPKDKVVKITIYSSKVYKIRNHLYSKNFNHSLTINNTTGGYSLTEQKNIEIICMFIEVPKILQEIKTCDASGLITITRIKGIDGKLTIASSIN